MITKLTVDDIKALAYYIKKESKMKEMYLKDKFYGKFGELTDMTYKDGSPLHTGDIVELRGKDGSIMGHGIVAYNGVFSNKFINGKSDNWRIKLVCKYYNNNETKVGNIIIKTTNNDQFIQLEGGKLNITKSRELGLWKEDKKVFTIDKNCEIEFNEYKIKSTVNTFWKRIVRIFNRDELVIELINPTPDKVRHEFAYYGIEVDVYD